MDSGAAAQTGAAVRTIKGHVDAVYAVDYSPDGTRIVSGGYDSTVRVWDAQTGEKPSAHLRDTAPMPFLSR